MPPGDDGYERGRVRTATSPVLDMDGRASGERGMVMKTFITVADLEKRVSEGKNTLRLGPEDVLTAAALEEVGRLGLTVERGSSSADTTRVQSGQSRQPAIVEGGVAFMTRGAKPKGCVGPKEQLSVSQEARLSGATTRPSNVEDQDLLSVLREIKDLLKAPGRN